MTPKKIIFYTRPVEVEFHVALARELQGRFGAAPVVFASFFSQAIDYAQSEGFETLYLPEELRKAKDKLIDTYRVAEIDGYCREKFYGLNTLLQMERFLPQEPRAAEAFLLTHITVLDKLIVPETLSISSMYDHFVYMAAGLMAFEKGGAHFAFVGCGVPSGRVLALRQPDTLWRSPVLKENPEELLEKVVKELDLPPEERISYMKPVHRKRPVGRAKRLELARARSVFGNQDQAAGSYFAHLHTNWWQNALRRRFKTWRARFRAADKWDIHTDAELHQVKGPCVFMALHMEPEATVLMYSPKMRDQIEATRLVAEALPIGYTLLVKENPKMDGKRSKGYYEAIQSFPNVRLCSTKVSSVDLIKRSEAVVSLGGTVTVEARLRGKRAYCFGRPPFWPFATACGFGILEELSKLDQFSGETALQANDSAWQDWLRGIFIGVTSRSHVSEKVGPYVQDYSAENVQSYCEFIVQFKDSKCIPANQAGQRLAQQYPS